MMDTGHIVAALSREFPKPAVSPVSASFAYSLRQRYLDLWTGRRCVRPVLRLTQLVGVGPGMRGGPPGGGRAFQPGSCCKYSMCEPRSPDGSS